MKRILSMLLVLAMLCSLGTVFAQEEAPAEETAAAEVAETAVPEETPAEEPAAEPAEEAADETPAEEAPAEEPAAEAAEEAAEDPAAEAAEEPAEEPAGELGEEPAADGASGGSFGGLLWTLDEDGALVIEGDGAMPDFTESTCETDMPWYAHRDAVESVTVMSGVTHIGSYSFAGCENLAAVAVPDTVESIGSCAFLGCSALDSVQVDAGNAYYTVADYVLFTKDMTQLVFCPASITGAYTVPAGVTAIGDHAFYNCSGMTGITIPASVTSIGDSAFAGCTGLQSLVYGGDDTAAAGMTVGSGNETLDFVVWSYTYTVSYNANGGTGAPADQTKVADEALELSSDEPEKDDDEFLGWATEASAAAVLYKPGETYSDNKSITLYAVWSSRAQAGTCGDGVVWSYDSASKTLTISSTGTGTGEMYDYSTIDPPWQRYFDGSDPEGFAGLTSIVIGSGVTKIGAYAFYECSDEDDQVTSVTIGEDVTYIGESAFESLTYLPSVTIPAAVTEIGKCAFSDCEALTELTLSSNIFKFGTGAFDSLTSVIYAEGVTYIDITPIPGYTGLKSVVIPESAVKINRDTMKAFASLETIEYRSTAADWLEKFVNTVDGRAVHCTDGYLMQGTLGEDLTWQLAGSVLTIGGTGAMPDWASENDVPWNSYKSAIGSLVIGEGVENIGSYAFAGCAGLKAVSIPANVQSIGSYAFSGCTALTDIVFADGGLETVGGYAFNGCTSLETIVFPSSVTGLGKNVLAGCTGIKNVTAAGETVGYLGINTMETLAFAEGVKYIAQGAFYNCYKLKSVTFSDTVEEIGTAAFRDTRVLTSVTIPENVVFIGSGAFSAGAALEEITILGWNCIISDSAFGVFASSDKMTVHGYAGSTTQTYVEAYEDEHGQDGKMVFVCVVHSHVKGAEPDSVITTADERLDGEGWFTCQVCGTSFKDTIHTYTSAVTRVPTDEEVGFMTYTCVVCGDVYSEIIPRVCTDSGACGTDALWCYNAETGTLVVYGSGVMEDYSGSDSSRAPWYSYKDSIQKILVCENVTGIGSYAFADCTAVQSVVITAPVETIGKYAFSGTTLGTVGIPESVKSIGDHAFSGSSIGSIEFSEGLETIGDYAFADTAITELEIPYGVKTIGNYAFSGSSITAIELPEGLKKLGSYAFSGSSITSIELPEGLETIGDYAFADTAITELELPEGVKTIGKYAFAGLSLTKIEFSAGPESIGDYAFAGTAITGLEIPDGVKSIGKYAFSGCTALESVTIAGSAATIGNCAFSDCTGLKTAELSDGVQVIGDYAFSGCTALEDISIPGSVTIVGTNAFRDCTSLKTAELSEGLTVIGEYAFDGCIALESIAIPGSVTKVWGGAFMNCTALKTAELSDGIGEIGESAFSGCTALESITIPGSVTTIGENAFLNCQNLKTAELTDGLETIGEYAFYGCTWLEYIELPESLKTIGRYAFAASGLDSIFIPGSVEEIGDGAFADCRYLEEVEIEDGVRTIGAEAFQRDIYIENITIPASVTGIGDSAFLGCQLDSISVYSRNCELGENAIAVNRRTNHITVYGYVGSTTEAYVKAFDDPDRMTYGCLDHVHAADAEPVVVKEPTAAEDGLYQYVCTYCGLTYQEPVPKTGGSGGTCSENISWKADAGTGVLTISGSGAMPEYEHGYDAPWDLYRGIITAVAVEDGVTEISDNAFDSCYLVTDLYVYDPTCAFGSDMTPAGATLHGYTSSTAQTFAAITAEYTFECLVHQHLYYGYNASGTVVKEPTCTETGLRSYECSVCGVTYTEVIPATGVHTYDEGTVTREATAAEAGVMTYTCTVCGNTYTEEIPRLAEASGVCGDQGDNVTWVLRTDTGVLTISGTGAMEDYAEAGEAPWYDCRKIITLVDIEDGVTSVGACAFADCGAVTEIAVPESVEEIGCYAFEACAALTDIVIPEGVTEIGGYTFDHCAALTAVSLPDGLESIGEGAFRSCAALEDIEIPDTVTEIGRYAFYACCKLADVTIPEGVTTIEKYAFAWCKKLADVTIPDSVTAIGDYAFWYCRSLASVTIPEGVTSIGKYAFCNAALKTASVPETVTSVGAKAFYGSSLKDLYIYNPDCRLGSSMVSASAVIHGYIGSTAQTYADGKGLAFICLVHQHAEGAEPVTVIAASTCTETGTGIYACDVCGTEYEDSIPVDPNNHTWEAGEVITLPTSAAPGECALVCAACGAESTGEIPAAAVLGSGKAYTAVIGAAGEKAYYEFTSASARTYVLYTTGGEAAAITLYSEDGTVLQTGSDRAEYTMAAGETCLFEIGCADAAADGNIAFRFGRVYTIKYNANGGTGAPAAQTKDYGRPVTITTETPARSGYFFLGWATSNAAEAAAYQAGGSYTGNGNTTLYAVWEDISAIESSALASAKTYTARIAEAGSRVYYAYTPTESKTYVLCGRSGEAAVTLYDADGNILAAGSGEHFRAAAAMTAGRTYYFAITAAEACDVSFTFGRAYTIKYNPNGGTGAPAAQTKDYGRAMTITEDIPTREGYTFLGWSADKSAAAAAYLPGGSYTANGNTTLYAVWQQDS